MSNRMVKTACRYDEPFREYLGARSEHNEQKCEQGANRQRYVPVFTSELGNYAVGLMSDKSHASFDNTVP